MRRTACSGSVLLPPSVPESELLINSLVSGLLDIEEEYGEPYIKIRFEEV